ncbi:hypothetical protein [Variovorax ginsengisoli]|uniref:Uncharacterized protein n=1 Tax=Variovorax ginsengisoli TaxID=363844 RepID=A0ABT8RZ44_9BURK|nr:hypothetical protein [Variovorax ginsengisoli]MDN8612771.1 hypothetical protein [Variovorax ginsengisoli]MDO1531941.1 hypothetical protein [Variovorax ginsengisoli]
MIAVPFKRHMVGLGDLLVLERDRTRRMMFKFCLDDGSVVATWLEQRTPQDVILRQKDVLMLRSA